MLTDKCSGSATVGNPPSFCNHYNKRLVQARIIDRYSIWGKFNED